jgi:hypothetical protein
MQNPYAAGKPMYAKGAPNVGPVKDKSGYRERDVRLKRNALLRQMQVTLAGKYFSSPYLRGKNA